MKKNEIGVGLLGFGTVGGGVAEVLTQKADLIEKRAGIKISLRKIADLDITSDRGVAIDKSLLTTDAESVILDPSVDIIVELVGGIEIAGKLIKTALRAGKPVVTANKALLAECGAELYDLAEECGSDIFFEASVGGGIPVIKSLRDGLVTNKITSMYGILNGTCNYILTKMEKEGLAFDKALFEAQQHGFAEADPSLDIDGADTAHKAVILASLAYGFNVKMDSFEINGIRGLDKNDIDYASGLGYTIKMLAGVKARDGGVILQVGPALVPHSHILASVDGVFNAVLINGDGVGDVLFYGRGAGRRPTASAVASDIVDAARNIKGGCLRRAPGFVRYEASHLVRNSSEIPVRYYLRLMLPDKPGVFGKVGAVLGGHNVSIASLLQKESRVGEYVPVVITTHYALESDVRLALADIESSGITGSKPVAFRMEDFTR